MKVDVDLDEPAIDLESLTIPGELLEGGYIHDDFAIESPDGIWFVRPIDGHRKFAPWSDFHHPSRWDLLP